jgi:hypothetical protein
MKSIYLICYGNAEENVNISLKEGIIGASNHGNIPTGQLVYLIVKRNNNWTVVASAKVKAVSEKNPFAKPNRYKCFHVDGLKECNPFAISDVCKSELGSGYGLVLRSPQPISAERFVDYLEKNFIER